MNGEKINNDSNGIITLTLLGYRKFIPHSNIITAVHQGPSID
jgi:hypothetical protein